MSFKNTTHWSILQDNFVVGIGSGTTIVYAVERLGQLLRCMHCCDACPMAPSNTNCETTGTVKLGCTLPLVEFMYLEQQVVFP